MKLKLTKWMSCSRKIEREISIRKNEIENFMLEQFKKVMRTQCEIWLHGNCRGYHKIYAQIFRHKLFINVDNRMVKIADLKELNKII